MLPFYNSFILFFSRSQNMEYSMSELKQENMKSEDYIIPSTSLEHSYMTEDLEEEYDGQENFKHENYCSEEKYGYNEENLTTCNLPLVQRLLIWSYL